MSQRSKSRFSLSPHAPSRHRRLDMRFSVRLVLSVLAGVAGIVPAQADTPKLTVYTYASFVAEWGPGPKITPVFEQQCGCKIEWVGVGDGAGLLSKLKLEGEMSPADVV